MFTRNREIIGFFDIFNHLVLFFLIISMQGCTNKNNTAFPPEADGDFYQDIAGGIGLDFIHSIGDDELTNIIESVGGGAAFLDYDLDGYIDLYVCSGRWMENFNSGNKPGEDQHNHLYHNNGDGTFSDVTDKTRSAGSGYTLGVAIADYNNDGYPDIFLSNYGPNVILLNKKGSFSDVTKEAGVGGENQCSVGAVWTDYDNDGLLDLYVGNYLNYDPKYNYYYAPDGFPGPMAYDSQPDVLYHNEGNGKFKDVTRAMGIADLEGRAMGVASADYDQDGYMDIYVANDHGLNFMWHNDGGKKFTERGVMSGTAFSQAGEGTISMAVDFADYNSDGRLDIFVSDDKYCSLYENLGNGIFTDKSYASGIATATGQFVGWSSSFFDYDNDSDQDIFKTNGSFEHLYGQEDQLFENTGGKFRDVSVERSRYFKRELCGRGACMGDYDNDGDIDIYITNLNDKGVFLRNNRGNENNWLILSLKGTSGNRDGIGALVTVISGDKKQVTQKRSTTGYLSQNDPRLHFGLEKNNLARIEVIWPSGKKQAIDNVKANQILEITEP